MNIAIDKSFENFISDKVANGEYSSSTDVIEKALRLLQKQEEKKEILKSEIQKGIDAIAEGRYSTKTPRQIFNEVVSKRKEAHNL